MLRKNPKERRVAILMGVQIEGGLLKQNGKGGGGEDRLK